VRGLFKEVRDGGGNLLGYKRYPTYEQLLNPVSEVGTFRLQDLASPPGESTLARCVHRYNEARTRLLESPDRQAVWTEFAGLCESLDTEVQKYQARLRAEQPLVRFDQEAHFARDVLANIDWTAMEKGLGAGAVSP